MKKLWAILLVVSLLFSISAPALAAQKATATTLRLEKTEGTVETKNASGKVVSKRAGTRLYSGYQVSTQKASYAYISLDDAKAIKLDASSTSEVRQSGKNLEVTVLSGKMFFDVTEPLKANEQLTIRTSTMVTGVRGTCGWVEVVDCFTTRISLLEGMLIITSTDPLTGTQRTITIVGGQTATIVYHGEDQDYESEIIIEDETIQDLIDEDVIHDEHIILTGTGLTVENLQEEDVPGFVAVEVEKDKDLQKRIEDTTDLSVPEIIGDAEERLEKEEAAAEAEDQAIQEELEKLAAEDVDPLFEESTVISGGSGSSSGNTTPNPDATFYGLAVQYGYLNANGVFTRIPNVAGPVTEIEEGQPYGVDVSLIVNGYVYTDTLYTDSDPLSGTMDSNKTVKLVYLSTTLNLVNPTSTDMADALATFEPYLNNLGDQRATLNVSGTISNDGATTTMVVPSYFDVNFTTASLDSSLTLDTEADSTLNFNDNFTNSGTISGEGTMTVAEGKTLTNSGGTILIENTNSMHVYGTLNNLGQILVGSADSAGKLVIESGGLLENGGQLTVTSGSTMTTESDSALTNEGTIEVTGTLTLSGTTTNANSGTITTTGTTVNNGSFTNSGDSFSPAEMHLQNSDTGTYTDERADNLYVMVEDSNGEVVAWGIPSDGTNIADSPFYDSATSSETWKADHTYTLYGTQVTGTSVMLPKVTVQNVTLDLNGKTMELFSPITVGADYNTAGDLTIIDTSSDTNTDATTPGAKGTGAITASNSVYIVDMLNGNLSLDNVTLTQTTSGGNQSPAAVHAYGASIEDPNSTPTGSDTVSMLYATTNIAATNSTISCSDNYGINMEYAENSTLSVTGSEITSPNDRAIYFEAYFSTLTVSDSTLFGDCGIYARGYDTEVTVIDGSTVTGTGQYGIEGWDALLTVDGGSTVSGGNHGIGFADTFATLDPNQEVLAPPEVGGVVVKNGTVKAIPYADFDYQYGIVYQYMRQGLPTFHITIGDKDFSADTIPNPLSPSTSRWFSAEASDGSTYYLYDSLLPLTDENGNTIVGTDGNPLLEIEISSTDVNGVKATVSGDGALKFEVMPN